MKKANIITKLSVLAFAAILIVMTLTACDLFGCRHDYTENVVNPTCTEGGYTEHTCTKCGDSYRDKEMSATGHNYVDTVVDPTCTSEGHTTHTCANCSDSYDDSVLAATGHSYESVVVDATCSAEGYTEHTCVNCSDSYKDSFVPVTAHRFNGGDCINCGFKQPEEAITPDTEWYAENVAVFTFTTKEQLAGLASLVNEGISFDGVVIYLDADIDLGYAPWTPIGNADFTFAGTITGNGHKISNLAISSTGSYVGLFGKVSGKLSDFTVDNASVFVSGANNYIGILCGYTAGMVSDIKVDGYVDAKDSSNVGGILGYTTNEISSCESATDVVGHESVGGIVGSANEKAAVFKSLVSYGNVSASGNYVGGLFGSVSASNSVLIEKIENYGDVIGVGKIGGLVGNIVAPNSVIYIDNAENYGDVTGVGEIGGLIGYVEGKVGSIIQTSKSSAKVSGEYYVGGLVGNAVNVAISDCSNEGSEITASSCLLVGDAYYAYLGGYVGKGYSVENCVNNADITYLARGSYVGGIAGYLTNGVTECTNNGTISGHDYVGGIAGGVATPNAASVLNLNNTGAISGKSRVGGIVGHWSYANPITFGEISNSGKVNGTSFIGGIVGYFNCSKEAVLSAYNLTNTGDVAGTESHIGGLIGYVYGKDSSSISNSSVKANISGLYIVGGLIGKSERVLLADSTNEGSTVTATGFIIEGEETNVYLGGYVGLGYKVTGCTNTVDINYTSLGNFLGGIAGYATSELHNCTNNASITSTAGNVGGIAGRLTAAPQNTNFSELTNNGTVKGSNWVGGIAGSIYQNVDYCHWVAVNVNTVNNSGNIEGSDTVGGIFGYVCLNNYHYHWRCGDGGSKLVGNNFTNSGEVSGANKVGEILGYFDSDDKSTLDNYTVTGKITLNNQILEGTYDVGGSWDLTLTNRVAPEVEAPETEETPAE